MNFGVRLPGPFRVGISSSGRVNAGVTLGPFSVSGNVGDSRPQTGQAPFFPITLDKGLAELVGMGWRVTYRDERTAFVAKGWRAFRIDTVPRGLTWAPITSRRMLVTKAVLWTSAGVGLLALCGNVF